MRLLFFLVVGASVSLQQAQAQSAPATGAKRELQSTPARPALGWPRQTLLDSANQAVGWQFTTLPLVEAIDDKSGTVRFKIVVDAQGAISSVSPVMSTVSARQETLCREALLRSTFKKTDWWSYWLLHIQVYRPVASQAEFALQQPCCYCGPYFSERPCCLVRRGRSALWLPLPHQIPIPPY